jgi:multiple antibiotic resistance protein
MNGSDWEFGIVAVISLVFVVDPLGVVPAWLIMTARDVPAKRRVMAARASLTVVVTLSAFAVGGSHVLRAFGISLSAFQIAGGIVLLLLALDMMRAHRSLQEGPGEIEEGTEKDDIAITPVAIPMLAGPAAMTTVTMLMNQAHTPVTKTAIFTAIILAGALVYLVLRLAEPLHRLLGRTGIHVASRLLGLVLLALAVQFILDGFRAVNP